MIVFNFFQNIVPILGKFFFVVGGDAPVAPVQVMGGTGFGYDLSTIRPVCVLTSSTNPVFELVGFSSSSLHPVSLRSSGLRPG